MSPTMTTRTRSVGGSDSNTFQMLQHPAFQQAVNRAANLKCIRALQEGRIRLVTNQSIPNGFRPVQYAPRMDLIDDPQCSRFVAIFELPGMKSNDLAVSIRDGHLVVTGERKAPYPLSAPARPASTGAIQEDSASAAHAASDAADDMQVVSPTSPTSSSSPLRLPVQELRFGSFLRRVPVPEGIKESDVSASLAEGMLTVMWPRSAANVKTESLSRSPSLSTSSRGSHESATIPFVTGSAPTAGTAMQ